MGSLFFELFLSVGVNRNKSVLLTLVTLYSILCSVCLFNK
jgi:hypothetical protein